MYPQMNPTQWDTCTTPARDKGMMMMMMMMMTMMMMMMMMMMMNESKHCLFFLYVFLFPF